ncbi:Fcf1-domain-containing protein [Rozella allomycis CSF55]|uniref:Fcf1-domain-containing protein n=1 Tax=Rozella allomycis (strain CSF55) TaxID=988480 RepID=A0A075B0H7_ROZAC|nr:rRNA-processing protein FCF1-like protein [Rozella allomycis CSF55]RKP16837.1 Fcf1-domain-containing protein [Rozella allomycis CSF55]|eukprot:EPZ34299.1 rRNA-processing protein FCF1-like protein [Rozella allomycis CSF55]
MVKNINLLCAAKSKENQEVCNVRQVNKEKEKEKLVEEKKKHVRHVDQVSSSLFFRYNQSLGPPYHIILDTNFINMAIQNKLEIISAMMDCLYAKCIPCITDCVLAEIEKLGSKFRVALTIARDPRFKRLKCCHEGTYADDCIVQRVTQHKCYIVATHDKALKKRIRQIPGVPIMYVNQRKVMVEQLPESYGCNY